MKIVSIFEFCEVNELSKFHYSIFSILSKAFLLSFASWPSETGVLLLGSLSKHTIQSAN